jgi:hypothetical protein
MNMALAEIEKHLKTLRLHGMNSTLQTRLALPIKAILLQRCLPAWCKKSWTAETPA